MKQINGNDLLTFSLLNSHGEPFADFVAFSVSLMSRTRLETSSSSFVHPLGVQYAASMQTSVIICAHPIQPDSVGLLFQSIE